MEYDAVLGVWVFDHSIDLDELITYTDASINESSDVEQLNRALAASYSLVDEVLRNASPSRPCPQAIYEQAVLEVASEVFKRRNSIGGQDQSLQFNTGAPTRGPRDPLTTVYPMLSRYAGLGFA